MIYNNIIYSFIVYRYRNLLWFYYSPEHAFCLLGSAKTIDLIIPIYYEIIKLMLINKKKLPIKTN